jgi:hypothetical protein
MDFPRFVTRWFAVGAPYPWFGFAEPLEGLDLHIGRDFFAAYARRIGAALQQPKGDVGLIPSFEGLGCKGGFDPDKLDPVIHDFYAHTTSYALKMSVRWNPLIRPFGALYNWLVANPVEQLQVPIADTTAKRRVESHVELLDLNHDGWPDLRCWVRVMHDTKVVFYVGAFHTYKSMVGGRETAYLSATFPLPRANLAVALKMANLRGGGLLLSDDSTAPEAGSYLVFPNDRSFSMVPALGLSERFHFLPRDSAAGTCKVIHEGIWLGVPSFRLEYDIRRKPSEHQRPFGHLQAAVG